MRSVLFQLAVCMTMQRYWSILLSTLILETSIHVNPIITAKESLVIPLAMPAVTGKAFPLTRSPSDVFCPGVPSPEGQKQDSQGLPRSVSSFFLVYSWLHLPFSYVRYFLHVTCSHFPRIPFSQRQVQEHLLRHVFCAREAASLLGFPIVSQREMRKCTSRSPEQPPRGAPHGWPDPRLRPETTLPDSIIADRTARV